MIQIKDHMWHPCGLDIIEHVVTGIRQYEGFNHYELKSVSQVGACGKLNVLVDEHDGKFRFVKLVDADFDEYASGLQDFVEGEYFPIKEDAELVWYEAQRVLTWSNMDQKKRWYEEAKKNHERVEAIVKRIKESIKERKQGEVVLGSFDQNGDVI